jgi:hypothetical protein
MPNPRSVQEIVGEARERVATRLDWHKVDWPNYPVALSVLDAAGYPAMVEALAKIAALDQDVPPPVDDLDSARLNGWQDAARIARAVLGGEVQAGSDRSALERVGDRIQSEASRLAAAVKDVPLPYEACMAEAEIQSAVREWTALRTSNDRGDE